MLERLSAELLSYCDEAAAELVVAWVDCTGQANGAPSARMSPSAVGI